MQLAPFLIASILSIAEKMTPEQFAARVLPHIKFLFTVSEPPQIPLILIQHLDLFLTKTPKADLKDSTNRARPLAPSPSAPLTRLLHSHVFAHVPAGTVQASSRSSRTR